METVQYLALVAPTAIKSALFMGVCILVATIVWDVKDWDGRTLFWSFVALLVLLMLYYIWPWFTYNPAERLFSDNSAEHLFSSVRLTKDNVLSQFYAAVISGIVGAVVGWVLAHSFLRTR